MTCMRVDLKSVIYVTIHLKRSPSCLNKPSILPQGQIETILWGLETAYGKLHLYSSLSARKMEELETCLVMIIDSLLNMYIRSKTVYYHT
ncbi:unnamed protein product [Brassica napus]|uniref:(rape) hypothetical protein n=1 Tax=Brassica napus TaxID=3708 RepID=A0A816K7C5_BRANA|nr:unnamed protein product [Brassica napus]